MLMMSVEYIFLCLHLSLIELINILLVPYSFLFKISPVLLSAFLWQPSPYKRRSLQSPEQINVPTQRTAVWHWYLVQSRTKIPV